MLTHRLMQSCEIRRDYPLYGKMKTRSNLIHGVATGKVKFSIFEIRTHCTCVQYTRSNLLTKSYKIWHD